MRLVSVLALLGALGCAQTVTVKVPAEHTKVVVDGQDLGTVPAAGKTIEVRPGLEPLTYVIKNGEGTKDRVGSVARTEPIWWLVAVGAAGALCCAPSLAAVGFCVANPGVVGAPLAFAVTGDVGALTSTCVAPSWFTLPVVTGCTAAGMAPLGAALAAETVPPEITLGQGAPGEAMAH